MEFLEIKIELKGAQYLSKKNCECGYRKLFLHSLYKIYFTNSDFRQWSKDKNKWSGSSVPKKTKSMISLFYVDSRKIT